ncbi:carboxypeptidase-like regulatory domain-containing protein [Flavobacterium akiainvivens]|nr:carboxypeptidase-like regulatory domain-containing protein [Flavobacterium akiainvivens]SFQ57168.1 CarboxypepD_reg-like domain-containing protein [Flavobacterium akiainvivens]
MRYFLLLFLFFPIFGYGQFFTYKGIVSDADGMPLPGANVCVKNTTNCTTADIEGNYTLQVKPGDIIQVNYIGMVTREFTITATGSVIATGTGEVKPILSDDFANALIKEGNDTRVPEPSGTTRTYFKDQYSYNNVVLVKKDKDNEYTFVTARDYHKLFLELYHDFTIGTPIRLHGYQNTYAQGRSLNGAATYQSPETGEPFSWGPAISTLQTTANATPYYPGGDITPGVGSPVATYNRNGLFRNSYEQKTTLSAKLLMPKRDYLKLGMSYKSGNGILPTATSNEVNTTFTYFIPLTKHNLTATAGYNRFNNNLSNFNFIYNKAIFANAVTPTHFNNGLGSVLPGGLPRSYSNLENNPYYLLDYNLDENLSNLYTFKVSDEYHYDRINNTATVTAQFSNIENTGGNVPFAAQVAGGDYTQRKEMYNSILAENNFTYQGHNGLSLGARLLLNYQERDLQRDYLEGFTGLDAYPAVADDQFSISRRQSRASANLNLNAKYRVNSLLGYYDDLLLNAAADAGYSSTYKNNIYFGGYAGFDWDDVIERFALFGNVAVKQYEPVLQYNNLAFNSLLYRVSDFKQMSATQELFAPNTTLLTRETNYSVGAEYKWPVSARLELYKKDISNLYAPVNQGGTFAWMPAADYTQRGLEVSASYDHYINGDDVMFSHTLSFSTYKNKVTAVRGGGSRIAIAGFADVNKNYMVGQPLGAIVGSAYERDAYNNIVVGSDGFPLVAAEPKVIGDPNPDFVLGINTTLRVHRFSLNLGFDWSRGGQLWNGTGQTLDYYGVSGLSGQQRNVTNYVFNGVTQSGQPNTQPVSFYDVTQPVTQNRWQRYGAAGVAESAIESATYFRFNNLSLSYSNEYRYNYSHAPRYTVSVFINNVFVVAKSKTAFSANTMFNAPETSGLDYFNSPLQRMYGLSVGIKF